MKGILKMNKELKEITEPTAESLEQLTDNRGDDNE